MVLAQPPGQVVGGLSRCVRRAGRSATARSAKSMAWSGGTLPLGWAASRACTSAAVSHSAVVGPAAVGQHLGVLGHYLAPVVAAGQLQVHPEPDQQQRGAPLHGRVRMTPHRRAGRSDRRHRRRARTPARTGRSRRRSGRCGPGRPSRGGTGRSRRNGSGSACPVTSASRRPAGSAAVATLESVLLRGDVSVQGAERLGGECGDLGRGAEAGAHLGQLAGDLAGLDPGLGVPGAGLALPGGGAVPFPVQVGALVQADALEGQLLAGCVAQQQPFQDRLDDVVAAVRAPARRCRAPCGSARACAAARPGRSRRCRCRCRRASPPGRCVARCPNRSTRPSRCSCRVGFQARS